jgi:DNA-binding response OmpR family regulator
MADPVVLVVDDDAALLNLMGRRLEKQGYVVERAQDGRSALGMIEKTGYDLVVTDIYMPGVTGLELLRQAKERDPHTQVVVVTAAATLENAIDALNNGAFAYLTKPFDHLSVFDNVVTRAMDFRRLILDNLRMAEIQRRRGDMLEDEVTERVMQLQRRRREMLDLMAALPDGVIVVSEGGRISVTNPKADRWLALDYQDPDHPVRKYLESLDQEWAAQEWEVEFGEHRLSLITSDLPDQSGRKQKVVVIREESAGGEQEVLDGLVELKHGLAWLYNQDLADRYVDRIAVLAKLASDLEEMIRSPGAIQGPVTLNWNPIPESEPRMLNPDLPSDEIEVASKAEASDFQEPAGE